MSKSIFENPEFANYLKQTVSLARCQSLYGNQSGAAEFCRENLKSIGDSMTSREIEAANEFSAFLYQLEEKYADA